LSWCARLECREFYGKHSVKVLVVRSTWEEEGAERGRNEFCMNEVEARSILAKYLKGYQSRSYAYLTTAIYLGRVDSIEVGKYQIEIQVCWKNAPEGEVRVIGTITDSRRSQDQISKEFTVKPMGEFAAL
jgi:hypothetical protein